jgi:Cyclin, N-terminal domain
MDDIDLNSADIVALGELTESDRQYMGHQEIVVRYFCDQLVDKCNAETTTLRVKNRCRALRSTAIEYFKRFYLNNSVTHYDPRIMLVASMLLASKVEENRMSMSEALVILVGAGQTEEDIREHEVYLIESLGFDLKIYHPINACYALITEYKLHVRTTRAAECQATNFEQLEALSIGFIDVLEKSLALLIHNPTTIAAASLIFAGSLPEVALPVPFIAFLASRFDEAVATQLESHAHELQVLYDETMQQDPTPEAFCASIKVMKSASVWGGKNNKKRARPEGEAGTS